MLLSQFEGIALKQYNNDSEKLIYNPIFQLEAQIDKWKKHNINL